MKGNIIVGQSGGPTAAINATLAGVIKGAIENPDAITTLYGMRNGIEGFLAERIVDLSEMFASARGVASEEKLSILCQTPAAALGSCRRKLKDHETDAETYAKLLEIFKKYIDNILKVGLKVSNNIPPLIQSIFLIKHLHYLTNCHRD